MLEVKFDARDTHPQYIYTTPCPQRLAWRLCEQLITRLGTDQLVAHVRLLDLSLPYTRILNYKATKQALQSPRPSSISHATHPSYASLLHRSGSHYWNQQYWNQQEDTFPGNIYCWGAQLLTARGKPNHTPPYVLRSHLYSYQCICEHPKRSHLPAT